MTEDSKPAIRNNAMPTLNRQLGGLVGAMRGDASNLMGLLVLWAVLLGGFTLLLPEAFTRATTFQAMMFQIPELGLLSLAMAVPLISGGLNLAIIATTNQAALFMAWILTTQMPPDAAGAVVWMWLGMALLAGLVLCVIVGIVTGYIVVAMGVHPILVTLGTMTLLNGLSIGFTRGRTISGFPDELLAVSNSTVLGIPISFYIFILLAFGVHQMLRRTPLGIRIHMLGSNPEATRYSGVSEMRVQISVYVLSSILCWAAAVVTMGRFNSAGADFGQSYLLITILAAILGGINPYGGFGRISGLVLALAILQTISSGFNLLGLSAQLTLALWGMTLVFVMAVKRLWTVVRERPRG